MKRLILTIALLMCLVIPARGEQTSPAPTPSAFAETRRAAEAGDAGAQYRLGVMYFDGADVREDRAAAAKWFKTAAAAGNTLAQYKMGELCSHGWGVPWNRVEAAKWYKAAFDQDKQAAEQGVADAQYRLGEAYFRGRGVATDNAEAVKWFTKAAAHGDARAQYALGLMYSGGLGVGRDDAEAFEWFTKAAEQGHADALLRLGEAYDKGKHVTRDSDAALKLYRQAAEHGSIDAQFRLGETLYDRRRRGDQDNTEAVKWYKMAAEHGHARAQLQLGHMFGEGIGVEQDRAEAAKWYRMAAGHGSKEAITRLRYVEAKIRQNFQTCLSLLALGLAGLFAAVLVAVVEPKLTRTIPPGEVELVRRDMRKFLFTFLGQLGLVAAYCLYYGASLFDPRSGRTDLPNSPEYARLRLQVDYNGALQSFDYVIGCHLHSTLGASTGTPRPVAYAPDIFARRLPDGKALAIAAPSVCEIEIDPLTGTDIVPLMVVYDDADTLASGSAYATLDAFDSPLSELTFHGAALFPAAKEEYDDFRSNGEKNLVTPEHYFSANLNYGARDSCGIREINKPMAASCLAFARFEVPAAAREAVTRAWLRHGRPRFWMQTSDDIKTNGDLTFKLHMPENALSRLGERGLRRNPPYPPVFPIRMAFDDISRILARSDERLPVYIMEMPYAATDFLGGKTRGFAWCRSFDDQSWIRAGLTRVKGLSPPVVIDENGAAQAIAGSGVPELSSGIHHVSRLYGYFENDEYYYSRATIGLRRMNGEP